MQLYSGGGPLVTQWDAHDDINSNHEKMCGHVDQPIAALLKDLKARGLLDSTLVVWASEFGRKMRKARCKWVEEVISPYRSCKTLLRKKP